MKSSLPLLLLLAFSTPVLTTAQNTFSAAPGTSEVLTLLPQTPSDVIVAVAPSVLQVITDEPPSVVIDIPQAPPYGIS
ncbi:MAG: hypothetical protein J6386_08255 [Candidatus Synoicihabitans palmerolidicus]|nr:hypothetical protein [Candidatus Synoicihabitans palmerolidicus]